MTEEIKDHLLICLKKLEDGSAVVYDYESTTRTKESAQEQARIWNIGHQILTWTAVQIP